MTHRISGMFFATLIALNAPSAAFAFHGGAHGGGGGFHGGGGGFHGGGGFRGGFAGGGGFHPMGGFRPAAPAFNRTPSFSMPRSFEQPRLNPGMGMMRPGGMGAGRMVQPRFEPGIGGRVGEGFGRTGSMAGLGGRSFGTNAFSPRNANLNVNRPAVGWNNRYMPYHQGWVHGYWNGHYPGGWGWRGGYGYPGFGYWGGYGLGYGGLGYGGFGWGLGTGLGYGLGMGMGYGLSSWLFGPMLYNWGYSNYYNPYWGGGGGYGNTAVVQPIVYNYAQPIDSTSAAPNDSVIDQAMALFEQARESFRQADYARALDLTDQALRQVPNDPTLHEFRALVLFALRRYQEAAASLYAVLSVGPGWDWTTLINLYADPETYTQQLRALEAFCTQNPNDPAARFVLAYHYLTQGHVNAALDQLKVVASLQPKDQLTPQLIQQLEHERTPAAPDQVGQGAGNAPSPATTAVNNPAAAPATPASRGNLEGTWIARPSPDTTITLTFTGPDRFTWKVAHQGQEHQFSGSYSYVNGILTLAQDQNNALVGNVNFQDDAHFQFKVLGGGPADPGLTFTKSS